MALVGSLSFLGRIEEALQLLESTKEAMPPEMRARARFAIAIAATRVSRFKTARHFLRENLNDLPCRECADVYQGLGVYHYYYGRFHLARALALKALKVALKNNDVYIHAFASDLYGHALVQSGRQLAGIRWLRQAQAVAENAEASDRFTAQRLVYEAEAGLRPQTIVEELKIQLGKADENSYSRSNLTLELARQLTRRGAWSEARDLLDRIAPLIYGFENRRQEVTLQLRLAEISFRQGDAFASLHFLQAARRCLKRVADQSFEIRILAFERRVHRRLLGQQAPSAQEMRWRELRKLHRCGPIVPGENPFADLCRRAKADPCSASSEFLRLGYLGLWPQAEALRPGRKVFHILDNGEWIAVSHWGVIRGSSPLTPLSRSLIERLSCGISSKDDLVRDVWRLAYDPLRHDGMIYAALNSLRRALGPCADWLETHDRGWTFRNLRKRESALNAASEPRVHVSVPFDLNWRQMKLIESFGAGGKTSVPEYRRRFEVSVMTAWRDLDGLAQKGYIQRVGRGRSTVYIKVGGHE